MSRPFGLYIHIPFCSQRCDFCSFYLELYRSSAAEKFVGALQKELALHAERHVPTGRPVQSIYFGGGTPTVLGAVRLAEILMEIRTRFEVMPDCEITVEAHPATVTERDLSQLAESGVTRISFGAESMLDRDLVRVGRPGLASDTSAAVSNARAAGFTNLNLDLMYGLPDQSLDAWKETLARCIQLSPEHLSCYALTVEPGTMLAHNIAQHRCPAPDEDLQVVMDDVAHGMLRPAGFDRYEISNYAKPGYACRHNLLYWTAGEYLGLGPSAQSFLDGMRFGNVANLAAYERALSESRLPVEERVSLTDEEQLRDAVVFGLRLARGIPAQSLQRHGRHYGHSAAIGELRDRGLLEESGDHIRLTATGRLQADTIAEKLY